MSFTLNAAAIVTVTLKRQAPGRHVKGSCAKATKNNSKHMKCTRLLTLKGTITVSGTSGPNHFTLNGKIGGHTLAPGSYQRIATTTGGKPDQVSFTIQP